MIRLELQGTRNFIGHHLLNHHTQCQILRHHPWCKKNHNMHAWIHDERTIVITIIIMMMMVQSVIAIKLSIVLSRLIGYWIWVEVRSSWAEVLLSSSSHFHSIFIQKLNHIVYSCCSLVTLKTTNCFWEWQMEFTLQIISTYTFFPYVVQRRWWWWSCGRWHDRHWWCFAQQRRIGVCQTIRGTIYFALWKWQQQNANKSNQDKQFKCYVYVFA